MTYEVVSDTEAAYAFFRTFFPQVERCEYTKGLCLKKDGETIAAVTYEKFNGSNVFMHVAGKPGRKWLNRWFLHEAFKHPFQTLGVRRITVCVDKDNVDSRRFIHHLGFTQEAVLKAAGRSGVDVAIYRMFREDCRYA